MGIVNVTPDSFSDGGRFLDPDAAIAHGLALVEAGANVLDVGGESTRPGSDPVDDVEERRRVVPVIEALAAQSGVPISVDTTKATVASAALTAGARIVNDISAGRTDDEVLSVVAQHRAGYVAMHMQGEPRTMQDAPHYDDVVSDVHRFLAQRIFACEMSGIAKSRIAIDPGFGFGKTLEHNLALLRQLARFTELGVPVLAGLSRKSMLGTLTGRDVLSRVHASVAAAVIAAQHGARLIRVHDVAATRDALAVWQAVALQVVPAKRPAKAAARWSDDD
jgi:dihydropteroate synthase